MRELENYKEIDRFNSMTYEKDLIANSRLKYTDKNDIAKKTIYTDAGFSAKYSTENAQNRDLNLP